MFLYQAFQALLGGIILAAEAGGIFLVLIVTLVLLARSR